MDRFVKVSDSQQVPGPGKLYVAPLGTENWVPLGYADDATVNFASEDMGHGPGWVMTGRSQSVRFDLQEVNAANLLDAFGRQVTQPESPRFQLQYVKEPETKWYKRLWLWVRRKPNNKVILHFPQVIQTGTVDMTYRKGSRGAKMNTTFHVERPIDEPGE